MRRTLTSDSARPNASNTNTSFRAAPVRGRGWDIKSGGGGYGQKNNNNNNNSGANTSDASSSLADGAAAPLEPTARFTSVFTENDKIAFASYDEGTNEILIESSHAHGQDTRCVVDSFISVARPTLVLVGNGIAGNSALLELLTKKHDLDVVQSGSSGGSAENHEKRDVRKESSTAVAAANCSGKTKGNDINVAVQDSQALSSSTKTPYKILKSVAFDLRSSRAIILNKLRVLTLLRHNQLQNEQKMMVGQYHPNMQQRWNDPASAVFTGVPGRHGFHRGQFSSTPASSYHSLASVIDFDSTVLLRALGGLLSYLQSTTFRFEEGGTITVNNIRQAQTSTFMRIDASTLHSLHVFSTEHHPLIAKGSGHAKEGFSLFTLLDRTKSRIGRNCLRDWMLKPLMSVEDIGRRQDGVELCLLPQCTASVGAILNLLQKVGAVDKILLRMQRCHTAPRDFLILSKTLEAAEGICALLATDFREQCAASASSSGEDSGITTTDKNFPMEVDGREGNRTTGANGCDDTRCGTGNSHPCFSARANAFLDDILERCHVPVLQDLHERIIAIVNEELTAEAGDAVLINFGFHEELDSAKEAFETLDDACYGFKRKCTEDSLLCSLIYILAANFSPETLSAIGAQVLKKHPEIGQLKVVFLPQVGFLVSIDKRQQSHDPTTNEFPDLPPTFNFVFTQETQAFFKNPDMRRLDDEIGDLDAFIKDTESLIVSELEDEILDRESEIRGTFDALAELDCILSFASCAADLNFVRPEMVSTSGEGEGADSVIFIENGRHPLQELIIDGEFIKNDSMIDRSNRVNVVTGPNFSGKSCYTRQVGMLVYLSQIGSFLPCDRAKISVTDQILARISSVETCAVPQSSFQLDLTRMATILRQSTPRTLVLIDEFGKGTAPASGIAVVTAALRKLAKIGCRVICTTHFLEIFSLGLLKDGQDGTRVLRMAVHVPETGDDEAVPLFKLEMGVAKSSAGLVCAKMAGVSDGVLSRAKEILSAVKDGRPVQPIPARLNSNSATQASAKAALRTFLALDSWANATDEELRCLHQKILSM